MTRILLTGGSGFIAAHVLEILLQHGHSVVTTVHSEEKARKIKDAYPDVPKDKLDFAIVDDIAKLDAFDKAVISDPPFEYVIHTASPFHYRVTDFRKELVDPSVNGIVGILHAIKRSSPTVKRVVITSSFAAIIDLKKPPTYTFSEVDWNPVTYAEIYFSPSNAYRAGKTFAEKAAWDFVEQEKPNFTLATINPPAVLGPIIHGLYSLDKMNTSNERIRGLITGAYKTNCPSSTVYLWADVRDVALAHVLAAEKQKEAANQRFFVTAGKFSNRQLAEIIYDEFPQLREKLPTGEEALKPGDFPPEGSYGFDNEKSKKVLGLQYCSLKESVIDTVKSLLKVNR
ncbi:NADPH-dependent methylglyoxal reductase GRE2 [Paracoccidioides lutzii Pb01]|uniref:NADPH-dependent methylglyoxal reductase GRE2 n=1 Tax=Paracoccidioides lutzii (strain ATCC MYA-826 / Pb01) TaxID=502779 RepID=C1H8C3_PARBA|nr:NADPH-dependent methylglyoxal reductase GRE2 [Paracoccidioides lutzii Pb01]EEH36501.2 NADPH-dependent methylglyoxal reductase GRE2 [Paracoccidioides lutzii Pb01]